MYRKFDADVKVTTMFETTLFEIKESLCDAHKVSASSFHTILSVLV